MASFRKRGTVWQYRISYKDGEKYREKTQSGFRTKKEAQLAAARIESVIGVSKNGFKDNGVLFVDYFRLWYELYKKPAIGPKTQKNYELSIKLAEQYFVTTKLKDLTEELYQGFINWYGNGHAKESVQKVHIHAKSCLKKAVKNGALPFNPAEDAVVIGTVAPKQETTKYLSVTAQASLRKAVIKNLKPWYTTSYIILLSLATGLRYGEVLGLTWDCIDFENKTITVNKTWDYQETLDFAPTKNEASMRTITVDQASLDLLKELRKYQTVKSLHHKNLVFIDPGTLLPPSNNATNKALERACNRSSVAVITHHGLRHSHVSLLLSQGVSLKYVSRRVGHANMSTTMDVYAHILDEMEQNESKLLNEALKFITL